MDVYVIAAIFLSAVSVLLGWPFFSYVLFLVFRKKKTMLEEKTSHSCEISVLICAHNEEKVIGELLDCITAQTLKPKRIYLMADGCADATVAIAQQYGVVVWERIQPASGKAAALTEALLRLQGEMDVGDAIMFLDADTFLPLDYMEKTAQGLMNADIAFGKRSIKQDKQTGVSLGNAYAILGMDRLYFSPRNQRNRPVMILGSAYAVRISFLRRMNWQPQTLTEDLDFTIQARLEGARFCYVENACYEEAQPRTLSDTVKRFRRWIAGSNQCLALYGGKLLSHYVRNGQLDEIYYLWLPVLLALKECIVIGLLGISPVTAMYECVMELLFSIVSGFACAVILKKEYHVKEKWKVHILAIVVCAGIVFALKWLVLSTWLFPVRKWRFIEHESRGDHL